SISLGEILAVRKRRLIRHENGRRLERALAEYGSPGHRRHATAHHEHIWLPAEDVEGVPVDETAVVGANVEDDAFLGVTRSVEIEVELRDRGGTHVDHVNVAEPTIADTVDVRASLGDPRSVQQTFF